MKNQLEANRQGASPINVYTDLAVEVREALGRDDDIDGVCVTVQENATGDISITQVVITTEDAAEKMGKPIGTYITIESEAMKQNNTVAHTEIKAVFAEQLAKLTRLDRGSVVLVVGLGNPRVTPDALGPQAISKLLVTRHLSEAIPPDLAGDIRPLCAVSPGVMGMTGIETAEIVKGIVDRVRPNLVIAIDALAARHTRRINATIQLSDTGISPGAGMGNKRKSIDMETLGVPVIAVGVPTVVDAATLVNDTMDSLLDAIIAQTDHGTEFYDMLKNLESEDKHRIITECLHPFRGNMFVTPKEVDATIDRLSNVIAGGINIAMHEGLCLDDIQI